jgi:predicted RNA binding protein with dsRBD fold (UPF0201 family)
MSVIQSTTTREPVQATETHEKVLEYTRALFSGAIQIFAESDPETDEQYFVVSAVARGEVEDILRSNDIWHRKITEVARELAGRYQLSLEFQ